MISFIYNLIPTVVDRWYATWLFNIQWWILCTSCVNLTVIYVFLHKIYINMVIDSQVPPESAKYFQVPTVHQQNWN